MSDETEALDLVRAIAEIDPLEYGVTTGQGSVDDVCRFCEGFEYGPSIPQHEDDCVWVRARRLLGLPLVLDETGSPDGDEMWSGWGWPRRQRMSLSAVDGRHLGLIARRRS